jgi:BirA family biotin operon repressor/biotin-[acetyl-CoA-carboxylase] ligase
MNADIEPLDAAAIRALLAAAAAAQIDSLEVAASLPSTNDALLARAPPPEGRCAVLFAENQAAGRGRRGRRWHAAPGGSLCVSLATQFATPPRDLAALSLVIGLAVLAALEQCGARGLALKWPNDIVAAGRKAGGILVDLRSDAGGRSHIVAGIGLNLRLPAELAAQIARERAAQPADEAPFADAIDLEALGVDVLARNRLAAAVVGHCVLALGRFAQEGWAPFAAQWPVHDALRGRAVSVHAGGLVRHGIARGVDAGGALLVDEDDGGRSALSSGEVSIRALGAAADAEARVPVDAGSARA